MQAACSMDGILLNKLRISKVKRPVNLLKVVNISLITDIVTETNILSANAAIRSWRARRAVASPLWPMKYSASLTFGGHEKSKPAAINRYQRGGMLEATTSEVVQGADSRDAGVALEEIEMV